MFRPWELRLRRASHYLVLAASAWGAGCELDEREFSEPAARCPGSETCEAEATGTAGISGAGGSAAGSPGGLGGSGQAGADGVASAAGSGANAEGTAGDAGAAADPSTCGSDILSNGGFEAGLEPWIAETTGQDPLTYDAVDSADKGVIPFGGQRLAWLGGVPDETNRLSQKVLLPAAATRVTLRGALRIQVFEPHTIVDFLRATWVISGQRIAVFEYDNGDATEDWFDFATTPLDVRAYSGQELTLEIESEIGIGPGTNFFLDDLSLVAECSP